MKSVATLATLLIIAGIVGWLIYVTIDEPPPPAELVFAQTDDVVPSGDVRVWCEGFTNGVIFAVYVAALNEGDEFTFPTEPFYQQGVTSCLDKNQANDPFPRGEAVNSP